jgi:NADPH2:quinone reductase
MRAIQLTALDGPDALRVVDVPEPAAGPNAVVIDVHVAGVGFPDLLMTRGQYQIRPEPPFTPGTEICGVVRTAPDGSGLAPGDRVAASGLGGWAEVAVAAAPVTVRIPDGMSFEEATAMVNYQTAYFAFAERDTLKPGETVLVLGAAGGTGTAAIDMARALGAVPIAIARGEAKLAAVRALGAEHAFDSDSDWLADVKRVTNDRGVDCVFDPVGGDRFLDSIRALARAGRTLIIGFAAGPIPELKINRLLLKNISAIGVAWGEWVRNDPMLAQRIAKELDALYTAGKLHPLVGPVFPFEQAADALRELETRRALGKVALKVRE